VHQLAPLFVPGPDDRHGIWSTPPFSLLLVEDLERAPRDLCAVLARALESGQLMLPQNRRGSLRNCMVFLTTQLCSQEILDEQSRIGFARTSTGEDDEKDELAKICRDRAEEQFGSDLLGQIDGLIPFRRIGQDVLAGILDCRFERLDQWSAQQGFRCQLEPAARDFLLERSSRNLTTGANPLILAHRNFVEFPIADLMVSGRIPPGGRVVVGHRPDEPHLHFTVDCGDPEAERAARIEALHRVPVTWA
jgi:ATP-dependent Clp protease ATP-binding subunit ClpB